MPWLAGLLGGGGEVVAPVVELHALDRVDVRGDVDVLEVGEVVDPDDALVAVGQARPLVRVVQVREVARLVDRVGLEQPLRVVIVSTSFLRVRFSKKL